MATLIEWGLGLVPPYPIVLVYLLVSAAAILISGLVSGALKRYACWKTGYTRKTLHFLIFGTAAGLHLLGGLPAVNVLGFGMGIYIFLAVRAGEGNFFFEAMAREKDAPRRGYFIIVPYLTTAAGGFLSNLFFGHCAVMGYVLCGAADAAAEPVGVRFGKHTYRVPSLRSVRVSERSLEGSLAVFLVSAVLGYILLRSVYGMTSGGAILPALILSLFLALVEAVSFHGLDNLTIQIAASGLTSLFIKVLG